MEKQENSQSNANSQASDTITYSRGEYENLCKTVGNLYLSLVNVRQEAEGQYTTTINALSAQVQQLLGQNKELESRIVQSASCSQEECDTAKE